MVFHLETHFKFIQMCVLKFALWSQSLTTYYINNQPIKSSDSYKDLGIIVTSNLSWSEHIKSIWSKAYRSLHLIQRSISSTSTHTRLCLYISLVCSNLSYCSQLWRPSLKKDFLCLENVQRRATKYVCNDYTSDYKSRLISLQLLPLMHWLELRDILFLVKCLQNPTTST